MRGIPLAIMFLALAGCSLSNLPTPRATYGPVPDERLYREIAKIPGVSRVELRWTNGFDRPNGYRGRVYTRRGIDAVNVLDHALAILRQGRPGASFGGFEVVPDSGFALGPSHVGLETQADYTARYGPQPGTGLPPPTPLRLRR